MKNLLRYQSLLTLILFTGSSFLIAADNESNWPRKIEKNGATIIIYQPQVESLSDNDLESRAAVSVTNEDYTTPVFGAMWFDCRISTDRDDRTVKLLNMEVTAAKFPDLEAEDIQKLSAFLEEEVPRWEMELSLDQLLADLDMTEVKTELSENLDNTPPEIIFTTVPTMLIMLDGDPRFEKIENSSYERVVNTPFFVVRDTNKGQYYINGGNHWYVSDNFDSWQVTTRVPKKLIQIAEAAMGEDEAVTATDESNANTNEEDEVTPDITLRTSPAELLQSDGEPEYEPIQGTSILFMTNTADDILMDIDTQEYYILVAGRWYRSKSLENGPWTFVDPKMIPEGFSDIPADSDMGSVRSSIAGTQEAKEAMLENQIPQTAEVDRNEARLEVTYDGRPQFEPVGNTDMKYAINTDKSVLLIGKRYYCCDNAIWFESDSPSGPWIVSTVVPESVQEIPPQSPVYNVKYVYIYDSTPDVVYVGYTPGYVNSYAYRGCVYYGTGYYYRPWYGTYYYPRPVTYGYNVRWNPYTGWGFSYGVSYGWMTYGWGSPYGGWWGPCGYRPSYHYGYHHGYSYGYRAGYYAGRNNSYGRPTPYSNRPMPTNNVYNNRAQGIRATGNTQYDPRTGNRVATTDRSARPTTQPANRANNVYTDRDGNVYRKDGNDWNRVTNGAGADRRDGSSNANTRPGTGQQPTTGNNRPNTGQQPATGNTRPSTGQPPVTGSTRPSTGQQPSNSNRPSNSYTNPGSQGSSNLNRDYNSRSQGAARSQQYQQSKPQYQQSRPPASKPSARPAAPSRSAPGRSSSGGRR
jgi:hypothetical protein